MGLDRPGCRGPCAAGSNKEPRQQAIGRQHSQAHLGSGLSILLDALGSARDDLGRFVSLRLGLLGHLQSMPPLVHTLHMGYKTLLDTHRLSSYL